MASAETASWPRRRCSSTASTGTMARLERELEKSRATIAEMAEEASRTRRFQAFEETLKNSRDYKITDLQRCCKDIKSRLDTIEGDKTTFLGLAFKSFEPINRKLGELGALQMQVERAEAPHAATRRCSSARWPSPPSRLASHSFSRAAPRSGAWRPRCPNSAGPSRRPISRPSASRRSVVGRPIAFSRVPSLAVGSA